MLYESSLREERDALTVGTTIERDGQVELCGVDTDRSASDRHALRIAGELELRRRRPQILKREVAVAEDVHLTLLDPSMHPAGHLKALIRTQVGAGQNILAAFDHVCVARIVDDDGVQPANVERGLAGRRHR